MQVIQEFIQLLEAEAKSDDLQKQQKKTISESQEWFRKAMKDNTEFIYELLYREEQAILAKECAPLQLGEYRRDGVSIYYINFDGCRYPRGHHTPAANFLNCIPLRAGRWKYQDNITKMVCDMFFVISPADWREMECLTGKQVPEQLKGWQREDGVEEFDIVFGFSSAGWRMLQEKIRRDC